MMGKKDFWCGEVEFPVEEKKGGMCMDKMVKALVIGVLTVLVKVLADNWVGEGGEE